MSYDLTLARGSTVEEVTAGSEDLRQHGGTSLESRREVAKAMISKDSKLEVFESPTHIELSHPSGIQISFFAKSAAITVPFGDEGDDAEKVFQQVRGYADFVSRAFGYSIYDPQLDAIVAADSIGKTQATISQSVAQRLNNELGPLPMGKHSSPDSASVAWVWWGLVGLIAVFLIFVKMRRSYEARE